MSLTLRPYQSDLIAQCRAAMQQGAQRVCLQLATGGGKTVIAAQILASIAAAGKRGWFLCHRKELLDQTVQTFIEAADIHTGIIAAGYPPSSLAPVQVCSVQSLPRRIDRLRLPDFVIWDECHHVASSTWSKLAGALGDARHLGITATPQRLDGQGLGAHFDTLLQGPTTAALMAQGYLSRYTYYAPSAVDLSAVHRVAGDYNKRETADVMQQSTVVGDAVSHYRAHADGGRALVFAWSIEASKAIAASFVAAGVEAEHVDGETARGVRSLALARFRDGMLRVLCNVDLFGEGLDVPAVDAVFLLRPTQSLGLYLQQVGRGLRPAPGKQTVRIFDHVNNWQRHGLPDDERVWSLAGKPRGQRNTEDLGKRCSQCFGVTRLGAVRCSLCGAPFPVQTRAVTQVDGTLQAVDVDVLRQLGLGAPSPSARVCQRCGKPAVKRFCGKECFLAARDGWRARRSA